VKYAKIIFVGIFEGSLGKCGHRMMIILKIHVNRSEVRVCTYSPASRSNHKEAVLFVWSLQSCYKKEFGSWRGTSRVESSFETQACQEKNFGAEEFSRVFGTGICRIMARK
jgi:hypothetical protein